MSSLFKVRFHALRSSFGLLATGWPGLLGSTFYYYVAIRAKMLFSDETCEGGGDYG